MEYKKPSHTKLSIEELLNSLEEENEVGDVTYSSDVLNFFVAFNLEPGENIIESALLYKLFNSWSNNKISLNKFTKELTNHLEYSSVNSKSYFKINKKSLDISEKVIKILRDKKRNPLKNKDYKIHIESFISFYSLKQGKFWVTAHALFYLYDKWNYSNNYKSQLGFKNFTNYCKLYFNFKMSKQLIYFRVNRDNLFKFLSVEKLKELEIARKKKDAKNKKRKNKVPKSSPGIKSKN